jgi:cbb3-type cytochrome c oxidase subunit III
MMKFVVAGAIASVMGAAPVLRAAPAGTAVDFATMAQDTSGKAIFTGKGNCYACHGADGKGTPLAPDLTDAKWLNGDGSLAMITKTVKEGVAAPKEHPTPMPAMGGATLTDKEVASVAAYVLSLSPKK